MKLQSQVSRKVGNKEYKKSWIVIPQKILEKLDWKTGQGLKADVKKGELRLKKKLF